MNKYVVTEDLTAVLAQKILMPTTVMWNRLEGRPRRPDFSRALQAEARDPLWLITRQWQMGEFLGEDAGSPVSAQAAWKSDAVTELHTSDGIEQAYNPDLPLETVIEARNVPLTRDGRIHNADLRLALGRRWQKLLEKAGHGGLVADFRGAYGFTAPDPTVEADFPLTAHPSSWQTLAAVAGRAIDGGALAAYLAQPGNLASDDRGLVEPAKSEIDALGTEFLAWANSLYVQPDEAMRFWDPRHLEYGARLSAPMGERPAALAAPEYRGGHLDWFHFDAAAPSPGDDPGAAVVPAVTGFVPTALQFEGMPHTRHWSFEEGHTNFGDIDPDTTDIAKLLLIEFGLVYANDWFMLPLELRVGSLTAINGLAVTNVFGERYWIEPAVTAEGPVQSWQMFRLTNKGAADGRLFLPPTIPARLESAPVESVSLVRDEVSNMVWGLETMVQLADGSSRRGREVALELHAKFQSAVPEAPPAPTATNDAKVKYTLMNSVAEHWIPFIPVHLDGDNREIQLQRAGMPRLLEGTEGVSPAMIKPRTGLLREGLDEAVAASYFVAEEEVERAGTVVETKWQRCRWTDGRVVLWSGHQRRTGRGEASSGLGFDLVEGKKVDGE